MKMYTGKFVITESALINGHIQITKTEYPAIKQEQLSDLEKSLRNAKVWGIEDLVLANGTYNHYACVFTDASYDDVKALTEKIYISPDYNTDIEFKLD